jgi:hypothetical protein
MCDIETSMLEVHNVYGKLITFSFFIFIEKTSCYVLGIGMLFVYRYHPN